MVAATTDWLGVLCLGIGLIVGALGDRLPGRGFGLFGDVVIAVLCAMIGGALARELGFGGGFGAPLIFAVIGATAVLYAARRLRGRA